MDRYEWKENGWNYTAIRDDGLPWGRWPAGEGQSSALNGDHLVRAEAAVRELLRLAEENRRLREAMDPRRWTQAHNEAWCRAIPDTQAAFAALLHEALHGAPTGS